MKMSKNAKPTKYDTNVIHRLEEIKKWIADGWTDEQISKELDINPSTFYDYQKKYPDFTKATQRLSKWETHVQPRLKEIQQWCWEGLTDDVICEKLGIVPSTWYKYQNEHPTLKEVVNWGKSVIDSRVENSLLRAALGYEFEEIKTIIEEDKTGKKKTRVEKVKRYQQPNPTAMIFWLKNRKKDEWNDRREVILDTKQSEEERKRLFLEMIEEDNDTIDAEYILIEESDEIPAGEGVDVLSEHIEES